VLMPAQPPANNASTRKAANRNDFQCNFTG
jgi:hypothetical protein